MLRIAQPLSLGHQGSGEKERLGENLDSIERMKFTVAHTIGSPSWLYVVNISRVLKNTDA